MDVVVGEGSKLGDNVHVVRSVIGKNCRIEKDVEIQDCYIFDNCVIKVSRNINLEIITFMHPFKLV